MRTKNLKVLTPRPEEPDEEVGHTVRTNEEILCWRREIDQLRSENQALKAQNKALSEERDQFAIQVPDSKSSRPLIEGAIGRLEELMMTMAGGDLVHCHDPNFAELAVVVFALRNQIDS